MMGDRRMKLYGRIKVYKVTTYAYSTHIIAKNFATAERIFEETRAAYIEITSIELISNNVIGEELEEQNPCQSNKELI